MGRDLNDAWLRSLKPPQSGRLEIRDAGVVGLVLRITAGGAMTWSVRTRTRDGKQTRPKIGAYPAMGVAAARKAAKLAIGSIVGGADPIEEKRQAREARRNRVTEATVAERLEEWQSPRLANTENKWSDRYAGEVARICKCDLIPKLGKRPLAETTRADWTGLVAAKRRTAPAMAAAIYRVISSFLNHAEAEGWLSLPLLPRRGASRLAPPPAARKRVLNDAELYEVWRATENEGAKVRAFARLLILTAARELEVADIATDEVDKSEGRWRIPATRTKNREPYTVPLSTLALAELAAVWPKHSPRAGDGWRMLGQIAGNGFRGFSKLKTRLDRKIIEKRVEAAAASGKPAEPMPNWRWHDLRRTARTGMTRLGVPSDHAEAAVNHLSSRSTLERTYNRHDYADEVLHALNRWQAHVAGLVSIASGAEVVQFDARRRSRP